MTDASVAQSRGPAPAAGAPCAGLRLFRPRDPVVALGLAVSHMMNKPAFAQRQFGAWSRVLVGQINRGHFRFVLDEANKVVGFLGWAFASEADAADWLEGRKGLPNETAQASDCMIINAWAADSAEVNRILLDAARQAAHGRRFVLFKRFYNDGSIRCMRMPVSGLAGRARDARLQR